MLKTSWPAMELRKSLGLSPMFAARLAVDTCRGSSITLGSFVFLLSVKYWVNIPLMIPKLFSFPIVVVLHFLPFVNNVTQCICSGWSSLEMSVDWFRLLEICYDKNFPHQLFSKSFFLLFRPWAWAAARWAGLASCQAMSYYGSIAHRDGKYSQHSRVLSPLAAINW